MREEIHTEANGSEQESLTQASNGLVKWIWPALGSLSIGAIVIMILQSPELTSKLGIAPIMVQKQKLAVIIPVPEAAKPELLKTRQITVKALPGMPSPAKAPPAISSPDKAAKAKSAAGKSLAAKTKPGMKRALSPTSAADVDMAAITTRLKDQGQRIKKLENIVGAVTGSVPSGANSKNGTSSSVSKAGAASRTADVDHTHKTDSLNIPVMPSKIVAAELKRMSRSGSAGDTGDTHAAARKTLAAKAAAKASAKAVVSGKKPAKKLKMAALTKPGSADEDLASGGQGGVAQDGVAQDGVAQNSGKYGVRLVIHGKRSKLKAAWKKLSKKRKGNELSGLKTRVQQSKATNGKPIYALVAGPLPGMAEAIELCVRLKLKGIACAASDFSGKPL